MFILGLFFIFLALAPNLSVPKVSFSLYEHIDDANTKVVFEFPPIDSLKILVNLESLYGICSFLSPSALITF